MEEKIREQLHQLLDIVIDTNGFCERQRESTGTLPTVFMDYSGHVNAIRIALHKDGWKSGYSQDKEWYMKLDSPISDDIIEVIKNEMVLSLKDKKESEILRRDIQRFEENILEDKETLKEMKKTLRKLEKKGA